MRFTRWATAVAMVGTALLSACGSGSSTGNTSVRLLNASVGYPSLDLKVDDTAINTGVALNTLGSYSSISVASHSSQLIVTGQTTVAAYPQLSNLQGTNNTVIAWGNSGAAQTLLWSEVQPAPAANISTLLVMNLSNDAGPVDIYLTQAGADDLTTQTPINTYGGQTSPIKSATTSGYLNVPSGTYRVRVTATGSKTDVRLDVPSVLLDSTAVNGLILTSVTPGSALLNGLLMPQAGTTVTKFSNPQAKARVISALPAGNQVTATLNGNSLGAALTSPVLGNYSNVLVNTGTTSSTLAWSIGSGATTNYQLPGLTAGGTYSVLLWGTPTNPQPPVLLTDNASPPSTLNTANLRVLNAVADLGAVSLKVNLNPALTGVAPGTLSTVTPVSTTNVPPLDLSVDATGATVSCPKLAPTSTTYVSGSIYTVFLSGSVASNTVRCDVLNN